MGKITHVVLANETGHTSNPGCRAVRRGFDRLFALTGTRCVSTLPLGLWSEQFKELAPSHKERVSRHEGSFGRGSSQPISLDLDQWHSIRRRLGKTEAWIYDQLSEVDALMINAEGSMHHNLPRALALAALIDIARDFGTPVALMNSTIQAMDKQLIREVLSRVDVCHMRERRTFDTLNKETPNAFMAPDIAVLAMTAMSRSARKKKAVDGRRCIVAAGVLVHPETVRHTIQAIRKCGLLPTYLLIGDGRESEIIADLSQEEDFAVIDTGLITLERLVWELSNAALLVSGRHHINIFAMLCGLPFVPLPSNTWKIEATIEMAQYPVATVDQLRDLEHSVANAYDDRLELSDASRAGFETLEELIRELPKKVRSWTC